MKQKLVDLFNDVIEAAVKNGADMGGSYNQNMEQLYAEISKLLLYFELYEDYIIAETGNLGCFSPYKIVFKEKK